jgi:hypothetical protein
VAAVLAAECPVAAVLAAEGPVAVAGKAVASCCRRLPPWIAGPLASAIPGIP